MKIITYGSVMAAAIFLVACDLHDALMGFRQPIARVAGAMPVELEYREAKGGLVILRGRVNGKADVDFILDTGAPVSVLIDGVQTAALGLDSSKARPLGDRDNPATPVGVIQGGFDFAFGALTLSQLTAVVIPAKTLPCRERFDEIGFGGVIGADLFKQFVVEIDPVAKRVRLHEPKGWRAPPGATSLPMSFRRGHPFVETQLTLGDGQVVDGGMNVDIGMNRALTLVTGSHPAIVMPVHGVARKSCYVNGMREDREGPPAVVTLHGKAIEVENPIYTASPNAVDGERTNTIGIGLFKNRRLIIDYPGSRLVFG